MRLIRLALILLLLAGCAQLDNGVGGGGFSIPYTDSYTQSGSDELLEFGANMANMSASSRAEVCRTLLKRQKDSRDPNIQLRLMVGRLLSDACGAIPKILDGVAAISTRQLSDERLHKLVSINTEALKRMNSMSRKLDSMESKQNKVQTVLEAKESKESKDSKGIKKDENQLLREKLEAIRSMEKQMDESGGGN
jgi:hypothetical protein